MQFFPFIFGFLFIALGIGLIILGTRKKIKKSTRYWLVVMGISSIAWLPFVVLHNVFYAFSILLSQISYSLSQDMMALDVFFFLLGIPVCPLVFIVGLIGVIISAIKK